MRYLLADYDPARFTQIDDVVRLCYFNPLNRLWGYPWKQLLQIGTTMDGLAPSDVDYIEANMDPVSTLNGVCFHKGEEFAVWLNPDMRPGELLFELTLIHELCHGYLGRGMHGEAWRKYFGTAVIMYAELLNPSFAETQPEWQVKHTIRRYRSEEEDKYTNFGDHIAASDLELEKVIGHVEKHIHRVTRDFHTTQEMRKGCHESSLVTTPTPAYLACLQLKAGMGFPSK